MNRGSAIEWLEDSAWRGWYEEHDGRVTTSHGDTFDSVEDLRRWLASLADWPELIGGRRQVPKREAKKAKRRKRAAVAPDASGERAGG